MELSPRRAFNLAVFATFGVLTALLVWGMVTRVGVVLALLVVSFLIAAACEPLVDRLERRGVRRGAAAVLLLGSLLLVLLVGAGVAGAAAISQFSDLRDSLPQVITDLQAWVQSEFGVVVDLGWLVSRVEQARLTSLAGDISPHLLAFAAGTLACVLISFYLIVDGRRIRRGLCSLLPQHHQSEVLRVWDLAVAKTGGYVAAKSILATLSGVVHAVAFSLAGVPYALPLGVWVGVVSQVIPIVGTYLALGFPLLVAAAAGMPSAIVVVGVVGVLYQQIENYLLVPRLTRNTMDLHPLVGFVGLLCSAAMFGPASTLLAAPILATLQGVVSAYVTRHEVVDDPRLRAGDPRRPLGQQSGSDHLET